MGIATEAEARQRRRPLGALWLATGISLVGNQLTGLALPWLVLTSLGGPLDAGVVGAAIVLPAVFGALAGGVVIDRIGPRRTSVVADVLSGAAVAAIPIAAATVGLGLPLVVALAFLGALLDAPGATARQVILPELAAAGGVRLERANAIFQAIENSSLLIGPAVAGLIILILGPLGALWLDAGSFLVSAAMIRLLVPDIRPGGGGDEPASLTAGLRALGRDPVLRLLTLVAAIANLVGTPLFIVILPALATTSGQTAAALGAMLAAFGGGMVAGALGIGALAGRVGRRAALIAGFAGTGLALVAASFIKSLAILLGGAVRGRHRDGPDQPDRVHDHAGTGAGRHPRPGVRGDPRRGPRRGARRDARARLAGGAPRVRGPRCLVSGVTFIAIGGLVAIRRESRELGSAGAGARPRQLIDRAAGSRPQALRASATASDIDNARPSRQAASNDSGGSIVRRRPTNRWISGSSSNAIGAPAASRIASAAPSSAGGAIGSILVDREIADVLELVRDRATVAEMDPPADRLAIRGPGFLEPAATTEGVGEVALRRETEPDVPQLGEPRDRDAVGATASSVRPVALSIRPWAIEPPRWRTGCRSVAPPRPPGAPVPPRQADRRP